ncbi:MAG: hypothetical protein ACU83N_03370, partial [Gammaproteobacteria bacterium]
MLPIHYIGHFAMLLLLVVLQTAPRAAPALTLTDETEPMQVKPIVQLEIQDAIGPATSDYIERSMDKAVESNAQAILITMDTPGGLDTSMRQIIKKIIASPIPVITFVAP